MSKVALKQVFDNFHVNLRKNEGFETSIPFIPIPEYGQSNAPLMNKNKININEQEIMKVREVIPHTPNANMADHSGGPGLLARKRG